MKRYVIIAGETSGDQYGSQLMDVMSSSDRSIEFWGVGGNDMLRSGLNQFEDINNI